jgi:hypothetical protein
MLIFSAGNFGNAVPAVKENGAEYGTYNLKGGKK